MYFPFFEHLNPSPSGTFSHLAFTQEHVGILDELAREMIESKEKEKKEAARTTFCVEARMSLLHISILLWWRARTCVLSSILKEQTGSILDISSRGIQRCHRLLLTEAEILQRSDTLHGEIVSRLWKRRRNSTIIWSDRERRR